MAKDRDQERAKVFTRRAAVLGCGMAALFGALGSRLYYLQVLESERYHTLAEDNRINVRLLPPPRGQVVDRNGIVVAANRQNYRVVIVREQARDVPGTLERLGRLIELPERDLRRVLREVGRRRAFVPVMVRENLSWEEVSRIEVSAADLPGVAIEVGRTRHYPYAEKVSHLLGYVAPPSESELTGDPLLELPDFRIGKNGIEKVQDLKLRGKAGTLKVEVNALGRVIRELERDDGQRGAQVRLTLDVELQAHVTDLLGDQSASVVVLDIETGEVLALVSNPGYDPNAFSRGLTPKEWEELVQNERGPLTNKAISGQYAPGSTFKIAVALAALEMGISPAQTVHCPGHMELGDARFHCWKKHGHGSVNMHVGMAQSCDVYFYEMAKRLGVDRIAAMAHKLGLGSRVGIDLPGEKAGLIPTRAWKRATLGVPWTGGEDLNVGIGQGFVLATPLQLAVMTARAVSGRQVVPRLTLAAGETPPPFPPLDIPSRHLQFIISSLDAVTNQEIGTAFRARIKERHWAMGGKTGTAQVRRITLAERERGVRKNEDLPWRERDHALFVAFAPVDRPRFACAVVVEHGGGGSAVAAPIARDVMVEVQRRHPAGERQSAGLNPPRSG